MTLQLYKYLAILLVLLSIVGYILYLREDNKSLRVEVTSYKTQVQEDAQINKGNLDTIAGLTTANKGWADQHVQDTQKLQDLSNSLSKANTVNSQQSAALKAKQSQDPKQGTLAQSLDACCSDLASRLRSDSASLN